MPEHVYAARKEASAALRDRERATDGVDAEGVHGRSVRRTVGRYLFLPWLPMVAAREHDEREAA